MLRNLLNKMLVSATLFAGLFSSVYCATPCSNADLTITKITFTTITSDMYAYTYEIKNTGTASIGISELSIQNYVYTDAQGSTSKAAGGAEIDGYSTDMIAAGATYTGTAYASPTCCGGTGQSSYPYLNVSVSSYPTTECNTANNAITVYVELPPVTPDPPVATGIQSKVMATANVIWDNDTKSFAVKDWSGSNGIALNYTVITSSGVQAAAGKTAEEQSVPLQGLNTGMYIIYLSDGEGVYSKKIIY